MLMLMLIIMIMRRMTLWQHQRIRLLSFSLFLLCCTITTLAFDNHRHVCFFQQYSSVRGPHLNGLFDQCVLQSNGGREEDNNDDNNNVVPRKRVALFMLEEEEDGSGDPLVGQPQQHDTTLSRSQLLKEDLGLEDIQQFPLNQLNPLELETQLAAFDPTVLWIANARSALQLRYYMRTSGVDGIVERLCGSSMDPTSLLLVAEGTGVICAGSSIMALARGHDPAPEPQFRGLELLGPSTSVSFGEPMDDPNIISLKNTQVYVWSQQNGRATSFVMNPNQMGSIERLSYPNPVPPLEEEHIGGRKCTGEPAVDPSRMLQMRGDSEWFEGEM